MGQPKISNIRKHAGIGGRFPVTVDVGYDQEATANLTFVGPQDAFGPVVMIQPNGEQTIVTEPSRMGCHFGTEWVRRFFV